MGFSVDFTDNKSVSADDLNNIISEVGDGTVSASSQFVDDTLFYTDKLNCIRSEIVTGGVSYGCEAVLSGEEVIIGKGICFFDSGMRMKIDSEGICLAISAGVENFVYLYASPVSNIATAIVSTVEKTGNEYVPVCRIDVDGNLFDSREWCRARIPMMNSRFVQNEVVTVENWEEKEMLVASFPLTNKAYSYIIMLSEQSIAIYFRDTAKYTYAITADNYRMERKNNADYFRVRYYSDTYAPDNARLILKEENSCLNIYADGRQNTTEIEILVI